MAKTRRGCSIHAILFVFFLAFSSCDAKGQRAGRAGRAGGVNPDIVDPSETIFNVVQFGAQSGGKKDCTQAFMQTWNKACHSGKKARIVIPEGIFLTSQVILMGPCNTPSPIIFQLKGTIKASSDLSQYPSPEWFKFNSINGLIITGGGTFDGQGDSIWEYNDCSNDKKYCKLLPASIKFNKLNDTTVRGIKSLNSMGFHMFVSQCDNIKLFNIHFNAPKESPNTDGIHISRSNRVKISKSVIRTGDDCISIGQGCTNLSINKVNCGPGHGISIGSLGKYPAEKDVKGIIVKNCTLSGTDNGIRIKTWPGSPPSQAIGMSFNDIFMDNVRNPIIIDQEYCQGSCKKKPSQVKLSSIHYRNIRGTSSSQCAVKLVCSQQVPCEDIKFININLKYEGAKATRLPATSSCLNAKVGYAGVQIPPACSSQ